MEDEDKDFYARVAEFNRYIMSISGFYPPAKPTKSTRRCYDYDPLRPVVRAGELSRLEEASSES